MISNRYKISDGKVCIELKLKVVQQLFDMRDPAPFIERDLDDDAASYVLGTVREFHVGTPIKIILYFSDEEVGPVQKRDIVEAIHNHFAYTELLTRRSLRLLLKYGQVSLAIGLFFLALCIGAAHWVLGGTPSVTSRIVGEGLNIIGWVAMWRPIQTFLYDWWPIRRLTGYLSKLKKAEIEVHAPSAGLASSRHEPPGFPTTKHSTKA